ncbi:MAG TPA: NAD(P)-binding domain-containing protein [Chitinophagaceae bacterium]|nr:NAD(P)-binding domain-containing protein [Chitinophagaceae bacterium]
MKIGVIGSGPVGQVLSIGFLNENHEVMLGSRNSSKPELVQWQGSNPSGKIGSFREAAEFGDLLVLATGGAVAKEALDLAGKANLRGKVIIDVTNPIDKAPPQNGVLRYFTKANDSLMEELQRFVPEAKFVKAFNSVGNTLMYKPDLKGIVPTMFICGNDDAAKKTVTDILTSFGWETEDMGKVEGARAIEPLCMLWCIPGFLRNQWSHAFKLLR